MPYQFELYTDSAGEWRWRFRAHSGAILAEGCEGHATRKGCEDEVKIIMEKAVAATTIALIAEEQVLPQ